MNLDAKMDRLRRSWGSTSKLGLLFALFCSVRRRLEVRGGCYAIPMEGSTAESPSHGVDVSCLTNVSCLLDRRRRYGTRQSVRCFFSRC